jgi:hypothetical protein
MAFTATILIEIIITPRWYVGISYIEFRLNGLQNTENTGTKALK